MDNVQFPCSDLHFSPFTFNTFVILKVKVKSKEISQFQWHGFFQGVWLLNGKLLLIKGKNNTN